MIELNESDRIPDNALRWRESLAALWRRRVLLAVVAIGGTLTAVTVAFLGAPSYEATTKLAVVSERARIVLSPDPRDGAAVDQLNEEDVHGEVALLQSKGLIREVLAAQPKREPTEPSFAMRLVDALRGIPGETYRRWHGVAAPTALDLQVLDTAERLTVQPIAGSNLIEVSYLDEDAEMAARFVNELATQHVARRARYNQRSGTRDFFERQREILSERQHRAEESLQAFSEKQGIESVAGHSAEVRERLGKLEVALTDARRELAENSARAQFLSDELKSMPAAAAGGAASGAAQEKIRTHLVELSLQRSALLTKYAPTSIRVQEIDQQIASAKNLLEREKKLGGGGAADPARQVFEVELARVRAKVVSLKVRVPALERQITEYRPLAERLDQVGPERDRLVGDVNAAKEALQTYRRKEEEARFADALDESRIVNVAVVESATTPTAPEASGRLRIILVGAVFSLLLGILLALLRDRLDATVKSEEDLFETAGLPVLSRVSS